MASHLIASPISQVLASSVNLQLYGGVCVVLGALQGRRLLTQLYTFCRYAEKDIACLEAAMKRRM